MPEIRIDKEFQSLIPPLALEEYKQLEENIMSDGCRDALVTWNGVLIDGHNRFKICQEHNLPFKTMEKEFASREDAICWIITNQFGRRNLSAGERSILALRLEPIYKAKAKERMLATQNNKSAKQISAELVEKGETRNQVAKLAGVSHDTIDKVKKIIDHGTPEQVERIKKGDKGNTVNTVYEEVKAKISPSPAPKAPRPVPKSMEETFKAGIAQLKDNSVDASFTPEQFLLEYQAFAEDIIRQFEGYKQSMYMSIYPKLSEEEHKKVTALNTAMLRAVEGIISIHASSKGNDIN